MNEILKAISCNLINISCILSLILIFKLSNMFFGLIANVIHNHDNFDLNKIKSWIIKTILTLFGIFFLTCGVTLIPFVIQQVGVTIEDKTEIVVNIMLVIAVSWSALKKNAEEAFENYKRAMQDF